MAKKYKLGALLLLVAVLTVLAVWHLRAHPIPVLQPRGEVAGKERALIIIGVLLSVVVVVPVYILTFMIAWRYREGNKKARHDPDWDHNRALELTWWAIPGVIIFILSVIAWQSSHALDPYRPLASNTRPLTIQVVALDWKWLFIYPAQHIATVNFVEFPARTPVNFEITADAPMNSFWLPALGGQVYAMPGMSTELHLMADKAGSYNGSSANISGNGFADMHFVAKAVPANDFDSWVQSVKHDSSQLNLASYKDLARPSTVSTPTFYGSTEDGLYDTIIMEYMTPTGGAQ